MERLRVMMRSEELRAKRAAPPLGGDLSLERMKHGADERKISTVLMEGKSV